MLPKLKQKISTSDFRYKIDHFTRTEIDRKTDFDIFLKDFNCNLQRDYCWDTFQQNEFINSILSCRHIPPITVVEYTFNYLKEYKRNYKISEEDFFKPKISVIDGKQRLLTHQKFINNEFSIEIEGNNYFYKDLPSDYQNRIIYHEYDVKEIKYTYYDDISDIELVELFKWCNFAGTPQDSEYMKRFSKTIQ